MQTPHSSAGNMNMLKQINEEGDNDMKRTINKAWTESNSKRNSELDKLDLGSGLNL